MKASEKIFDKYILRGIFIDTERHRRGPKNHQKVAQTSGLPGKPLVWAKVTYFIL